MDAMNSIHPFKSLLLISFLVFSTAEVLGQELDTNPPKDAIVLFDGSSESLLENWAYWDGPRLQAEPPIKWKIVPNPVGSGTAVSSNDPAAANGKYGAADIVTKQKFEDFRLHVEFLIETESGNSGVYLQNSYEIQILDGDTTNHGMAAVINEKSASYGPYKGLGKWNTYDIIFRAARFSEAGEKIEHALVTLYFNGEKVHSHVPITKVWGGAWSGIDGGNDDGRGITDTLGGIKLQAEGHDVLFRNIWIKPLSLTEA